MAKVKRKNPQNKLGTTPLHYACLNGHIEVCRLMVGMLEDKNPQNMFGDTPLHQAAKAGHFEICKYVWNLLMHYAPKTMYICEVKAA